MNRGVIFDLKEMVRSDWRQPFDVDFFRIELLVLALLLGLDFELCGLIRI